MFHITRYIHPGYLSHGLRREIKEMYWAKALSDFALAAVMLFEPIFLYALGYSLKEVIIFFLIVYGLYLFLMPLGAKVAARMGYEHSILYSSFFMILYWAFLFGIEAYPAFYYIAPFALAINKSLYWPAFHADMARFSSADQRGRENSGMYALISLIFIIGPFFGGYIATKFGFIWLFFAVAALMILSNIPLFTTLEKFVPKPYNFSDTWDMYKKFPKQMLGYWGFGEELTQLVLWPIFIYMTVPDFFKFGAIISISTLIATVMMLYVGVLTDQRSKPLLIRYFSVFNALFWIIRPFFLSLTGILSTNTLGTISKHSLIIPITTFTYDKANETHIMPYVVFFEQNLVIGKIIFMLLVLLLLSLTANFFYIFLLSAIFSLLFVNLK
jgi:MFS family permease